MAAIKLHYPERRSVPTGMYDHCWVCHELFPDDAWNRVPAVLDGTIWAKYHLSPRPCDETVEGLRKDYTRSRRGRKVPGKILRKVTYGFLCTTCRPSLKNQE